MQVVYPWTGRPASGPRSRRSAPAGLVTPAVSDESARNRSDGAESAGIIWERGPIWIRSGTWGVYLRSRTCTRHGPAASAGRSSGGPAAPAALANVSLPLQQRIPISHMDGSCGAVSMCCCVCCVCSHLQPLDRLRHLKDPWRRGQAGSPRSNAPIQGVPFTARTAQAAGGGEGSAQRRPTARLACGSRPRPPCTAVAKHRQADGDACMGTRLLWLGWRGWCRGRTAAKGCADESMAMHTATAACGNRTHHGVLLVDHPQPAIATRVVSAHREWATRGLDSNRNVQSERRSKSPSTTNRPKYCQLLSTSAETQGKGSVLAAKAVETQGKGRVVQPGHAIRIRGPARKEWAGSGRLAPSIWSACDRYSSA